MTLDEVMTRTQGAVDLMIGRRERAWRQLDASADGFWESFFAIPVCAPALFVICLAYAQWLTLSGVDANLPAALIALGFIELVNWLVTLLAIAFVVPQLKWRGRGVRIVVALNWGSVAFAYARAIPAVIALLAGFDEGIAFVTLVITLISLVFYWRLIAGASQGSAGSVTVVFVFTLLIGYVVTMVGQDLFGIVPPSSID